MVIDKIRRLFFFCDKKGNVIFVEGIMLEILLILINICISIIFLILIVIMELKGFLVWILIRIICKIRKKISVKIKLVFINLNFLMIIEKIKFVWVFGK